MFIGRLGKLKQTLGVSVVLIHYMISLPCDVRDVTESLPVQWRAERRQLAACCNVVVSLYILPHYQAGWRDGGDSLELTTDQDEIFLISPSLGPVNLDHLDFPVCPASRDSGVLTLII